MGTGAKNQKEILAIVTTDNNTVANGRACMFVCKDEAEQKTIVREVALALRADVARLSSGAYLIITSD